MVNLEAKHFFNYNRFPCNEKAVFTIIYAPIGFILMVLRSILALFIVICAQVLPESQSSHYLIHNLLSFCFGINVIVENVNQNKNSKIYVGNYLSLFDHLAISKAFGFVLPLNNTPLRSLPGLGIINFGSVCTDDFKNNLEAVKSKNVSLYLCPEELPTNGKGILKFNTKYFEFFDEIQPICVTVKRPLLDISVSTISSTCWNDIIYFMYSPCTIYTIKILPALEKKNLSGEEFATIVRDNIATELKIEASSLSASDLLEWSKRHMLEEKRRMQERARIHSGGSQISNPELERMASLVKAVFPNIPIVAIYSDLAITRNIDTTITNILDGRVRYMPETQRSTPSPSASQSVTPPAMKTSNIPASSTSFTQFNTAAMSFGKNANERTKSFKERKEQLIAAARRRYIEKHNLDIPL
ncbi:lipid droplet-regulating VLDL assembly factor AUP1-like [Rhynchophorus ferrugineus]|uniref:lipid droplet-regulating VLDL assembly factor AUP1-like n=1 Tax=Rhynchophorus ferrugineus TaxID=354439 RepID=UPI003FCE9A4B